MSTIAKTLNAVGTVDVVCVMRKQAAKKQRTALRKHFTHPSFSGTAELAQELRDATFRGARQTARRFSQLRDAVIELPHLGMMIGTVDRDGLKAVRGSGEVAKVVAPPEISLIRPTGALGTGGAAVTENPTDHWGHPVVGLPALRAQGLTGAGVRVAHLDTGVDDSHPALQGAVAGWLETDHAGRSIQGSAPYDDHGHGTHTAGTLAGRVVAGEPRIGAAPGASLYCAKCIEGGDLPRRVLVSLDWAVGQGARIVSMSLGIRGYNDGWLAIATQLRTLGILFVCAVGNEGANTSRSPGNYPNVLSVGMSNAQSEVDPRSSSMTFEQPAPRVVPKLVAPGAEVWSAMVAGGYRLDSGSSMAAPLVAGLAALLLEAHPNATVAQLEDAILGSCTLPGTMPEIRGGAGVPNGPRALAALP